jgi:hypothetical protein
MPYATVDSLKLHKKLWMNEYDSSTHLCPVGHRSYSQLETREVFQKEFAAAITHDQGWWWYEFPFNLVGRRAPAWFTDSDLLADAGVMKRLYDDYLARSPHAGPTAEVAVIFNIEQAFHVDAQAPANTVHSHIGNFLIPRLQMIGAPYDIYAQSDLVELIRQGWHRHYKLILFANSFHLSPEDRQLIEKHLKKEGRTLAFFFAPGYQGNQGGKSELSVAGIEQVTGMKGVAKLDEKHLLGMRFRDSSLTRRLKSQTFDPLAWFGRHEVKTYGNEIGPVFYLDRNRGNGWQTLATLRLDKKDQAGKTALAYRKHSDYRVFYSVVPNLPVEMLAAMARRAGVHRYCRPGILTWANARFVCVHSAKDRKQVELRAPRQATWFEPFEQKTYGCDTRAITIGLAKGETKFFLLKAAQ